MALILIVVIIYIVSCYLKKNGTLPTAYEYLKMGDLLPD